MTQDIQNFIQYLHQEKNTSENTEVSYARDLKKMNQYLLAQGICDVNEVTATSLTSYVIYLEKEGRKPATISRSIASMKAFYHYMEKERRLAVDPSERLKAPRIEKKMPTVLTTEEVTRLWNSREVHRRRNCGIKPCWSYCMRQASVCPS